MGTQTKEFFYFFTIYLWSFKVGPVKAAAFFIMHPYILPVFFQKSLVWDLSPSNSIPLNGDKITAYDVYSTSLAAFQIIPMNYVGVATNTVPAPRWVSMVSNQLPPDEFSSEHLTKDLAAHTRLCYHYSLINMNCFQH